MPDNNSRDSLRQGSRLRAGHQLLKTAGVRHTRTPAYGFPSRNYRTSVSSAEDHEAVLHEAVLHEAVLHEAVLHEAVLHEAVLHEAVLHEALL
ncbi:MAG: hypothetical protein CYG59_13665 [Chloroflexi bacterium]|nr:MAG: hypothetical protein CYG59_13665 [Chloroflexota bacterium]